ncbi:MAG: hypothetical protein KAX52_13995, partial [Pseudomonas sp.]|nr:hypothetical protein [Pseudomonas sp.]
LRQHTVRCWPLRLLAHALLLGGLLLTGLAGFSVWPYRTTPAADMEQAIAYLAGAGLLLASAWLVRRRQGRRLQHNSLVLDPRLLKKGR